MQEQCGNILMYALTCRSAETLYVNSYSVTLAHRIAPTYPIISALRGNMLSRAGAQPVPNRVLLSGLKLQLPVLTSLYTSSILLTRTPH